MNPHRNQSRVAALALLAAACALLGSTAAAQTPEQEQLWEAQQAQALADKKLKDEQLAQQRAARKADPMAWVRTLNPMSAGGWQFRTVAPDGSEATFSTDHQMKRSGHVVTIWLRQEYPEVQKSGGGDIYLSNVEKLQYDCVKNRARALLVIYYTENNLTGGQATEEADEKEEPWNPIVPGTQSESVFQSICNSSGAKARN